MNKTIALAGNPNSGKTTLFNALTGARQHVGNYPGVTVEKKRRVYTVNGKETNIVDLPGTYSLTAYSMEEIVARDFLIDEKPDVVINIVDASNLGRNLYLTMQFLEIGTPVCIALNMIDLAENRGIKIDEKRLSELLRIPVVPIIARSGKGIKQLMETAIMLAENKPQDISFNISYGDDIDRALDDLEAEIGKSDTFADKSNPRWSGVKLLEKDEQFESLFKKKNPDLFLKLTGIIEQVAKHLKNTLDTYPEAVIADHRYGYIKSILNQKVIHFAKEQERLFISDRIDKVVTNKVAGPLIMLAIIMGLYHFTFTYSEMPVGWLESFFDYLANFANNSMPDGIFKSLVISGIIDGAGGVLGFVPLIMFMFFGIAILDDSGYLARMAFMLDRIFRIFGLHGSSVVPFIVSGGIAGGCAVPGIMATRTLKSRRERLATLLTVPFMNCGAKLPVFALLSAAFFPDNKARMMFILTIISWIGALLIAKILRSTVIKGEPTPFVMELPPYRIPTFKGVLIHTWEKTWGYIKKAGTVILGISVILWAMMTFPSLPDSKARSFEQERLQITASAESSVIKELNSAEQNAGLSSNAKNLNKKLKAVDYKEAETALKYSAAGRLGSFLEKISRFAGFDWRVNIALVGGFAAKEVIISTLGTAYSLGKTDSEKSIPLAETLASAPGWNPLTAFSLIIFTMFYAPCFVSVICIVKESGSWKWGGFSIVFNTLVALVLSVSVFQIGSFIIG